MRRSNKHGNSLNAIAVQTPPGSGMMRQFAESRMRKLAGRKSTLIVRTTVQMWADNILRL